MQIALRRLALLGWVAVIALVTAPQARSSQTDWQILEPERFDSTASARYKILDDQSAVLIKVKGDWNVTEFDLRLEAGRYTALRIECLEHESLPNGGPGRGDEGRFKIGELELSWYPGKKRAQSQRLGVAWASGAVPSGGEAQHAIDNNQSTAWGPSGDSGPLQAVFEFTEPLVVDRSATLHVRLEEMHQARAGLGRFRCAVTDADGVLPDPPVNRGWAALNARIPDAIDRGLDALLRWQELDGSYGYHTDRYAAGATGLALYTMLKCGLEPEHPSVERGMAWLVESDPQQTYPLATSILALCAFGPEDHMEVLESWVTRLRSYQKGGFAYPYNPDIIDLSCGQYAALALRAASKAGLTIPKKTWSSLAASVLRHAYKDRGKYGPTTGSNPGQGYGYRIGDEATGAMTTAGVSILAICAEQTEPKNSWTRGIEAGATWLADNFSVTRNPLRSHDEKAQRHGKDEWLFYYLYGVERVGGLLDRSHLGPWDWYRHGARYLLEVQREDGLWGGLPGYAKSERWQADTCFALLFLKRATAPSTGQGAGPKARSQGGLDPELDVSLRLIEGWKARAWIAGYGSEVQANYGAGEGLGLAPHAVEYQLVDAEGRVDRVLERIQGGPKADTRFPVQLQLPTAGKYRLRVEVEILLPDFEDASVPGAIRKLQSPVLEYETAFHTHPDLVRYAKLPWENLLREAQVGATASSQLNDGARAAFAVDQRASTGWFSTDQDPHPGLRLSLGKPARGNVLILTPHLPPPSSPNRRPARAKRVSVSINGADPIEADLRSEGYATEVRLPDPKRISRIDIELLDIEGPEGARAVGLSAVQLILRP